MGDSVLFALLAAFDIVFLVLDPTVLVLSAIDLPASTPADMPAAPNDAIMPVTLPVPFAKPCAIKGADIVVATSIMLMIENAPK